MGWQDQSYLNHELVCDFTDIKVQELDSRYNHFKFAKNHPTAEVIVRAWHAEMFACCLKGMNMACAGLPLLPPKTQINGEGSTLSATKEES